MTRSAAAARASGSDRNHRRFWGLIMAQKNLPALEAVSANAPLRLDVAARLAFPDGSMTASGLRREAARGNLVLERIAGKDFTTLEAIDEMRKLCRREPSAAYRF